MQKPFFSHDYTPEQDLKFRSMVSTYKGKGYALYWHIVELLHRSETSILPKKKYAYIAISDYLGYTVEEIEAFINDCIDLFELFKCEGENVYSERVIRNKEQMDSIRKAKSEAGKKAMANRYNKDVTEPNSVISVLDSVITEPNTNLTEPNKIKENKRKENKEKEIDKSLRDTREQKTFSPPTLAEVIEYFKQNEYLEDAGKRAYEYYQVANWKDSKGHPVKNWKQKMIAVWFKPENKQPPPPPLVNGKKPFIPGTYIPQPRDFSNYPEYLLDCQLKGRVPYPEDYKE